MALRLYVAFGGGGSCRDQDALAGGGRVAGSTVVAVVLSTSVWTHPAGILTTSIPNGQDRGRTGGPEREEAMAARGSSKIIRVGGEPRQLWRGRHQRPRTPPLMTSCTTPLVNDKFPDAALRARRSRCGGINLHACSSQALRQDLGWHEPAWMRPLVPPNPPNSGRVH